MLDHKPISTPKLSTIEGKDLQDHTRYCQLAGSLVYLKYTRLDISLAVGLVSRFMQTPKKSHLEVVRKMLGYVKGMMDHGVYYEKEGDCKVIGYYDADYAGDHDTRRKTTGYVISSEGRAVSLCNFLLKVCCAQVYTRIDYNT
ncbi:hypothetical protein MLD38_037702 [Melastoma candidum]|uniref:Uncharacterized protein n=1 Tax=Melastoma candidum TaxID=119954 RepID=A0ACB9LP15_9MYRT|nr:hypothetical protein MLD38_037702 [Melastoma candidum]